MIIHKLHLVTKIPIWYPRYHDNVVLISQYKVHHASSVIIIEFTKAKHLQGQRFCVTRDVAEHCPIETNGKINCYAIPMGKLEGWETAQEVATVARGLWDN